MKNYPYVTHSVYPVITESFRGTMIPKGISASNIQKLWDQGYSGSNVKVAVIDNGADLNHPDVSSNIVYSLNLTNEKGGNDHATHVIGTLAGNGRIKGAAFNASVLNIKALTREGGSISAVTEGIKRATQNGASIINMSIGTNYITEGEKRALEEAINYAWDNGCICIAAVGNAGFNGGNRISYPAGIEKVVGVAAASVGSDMNQITLKFFSQENASVDMSACGFEVFSCLSNNRYGVLSGTSMSAPHVSGVAALLAQKIGVERNKKFSKKLVEKLFSHIIEINALGLKSNMGKGFLRVDRSDEPYPIRGEKFHDGKIFLGHMI